MNDFHLLSFNVAKVDLKVILKNIDKPSTYFYSNKIRIPYFRLFVLLLIFLEGCGSSATPPKVTTQAVQCSTHQEFFTTEIWPILKTNCIACHESGKTSNALALLLKGHDFSNINFQTVQSVAKKKDNTEKSLLISKASNINKDHSGGTILSTDSVELKTISTLVSKLSSCDDSSIPSTSIVSLSGYQRLRKITLNLAGRLPTAYEEMLIQNATSLAGTELVFDTILDSQMTEAYFYERVKTIFNDKFLIDSNSIEFDFLNFANNDIFLTQLATKYPTVDIISIRNKYKYGLTQAPLELITHVVRENRPLTEILTANYAMVNSYTATLFNANTGDPNFNFVLGELASLHNETDFREAIITDDSGVLIPHAGILSSLAFLGRYPSSNTNKNRARSRYVYDFFLDIDVEGLASRDSLNLNNVDSINAPFNDPQCKACHTTVDPVAGLFKNWRNLGAYRGDNLNWFNGSVPPTMLAPGYGKNSANPLPPSRSANALQWLAENIVTDNAFAVSMVKIVFKGLTGQDIANDSDSLEL